ncbi:MAG: hypothetical protein HZB61_15550 [Nitrospirae bacterium]|nr:hypothetical protein [Nitrospirota bacterium]
MDRKTLAGCLLFFLVLTGTAVYAESPYAGIYSEYPKNNYVVGIGEVNKSGNPMNDNRKAEVLARLEIAKQIKVRLKEETIDIMCEAGKSKLFKDMQDCRNEFVMVVEVTVDEFLSGSSIADRGQRGDIVYAVAVLPRAETANELEKNMNDALSKTKEEIEKAKKGDADSAAKAKEEYVKAVTYNQERALIENTRAHASEAFDELEKELVKLKARE